MTCAGNKIYIDSSEAIRKMSGYNQMHPKRTHKQYLL